MSQQNKETEEAKKHIISGKLIIGFIIFTLACVVITVVLIGFKRYQMQISKTQIQGKTVEQMQIKSLTERYKENDLKILNEEEHIGASREAEWENDHNITKLNFYYVQIKGLKDKTIENKINEEIKNAVTKWYEPDELHDTNIDYISTDAYVMGNYGNTLSIRINRYTNYEDDWKNESKTLNYNLTTGEKIEFEDLFLPGVSIKNILSQVLYDYYITQTGYSSETEDLSKVDLSQIENKVYNIMSIYNNNPKLEWFGFSSSYIFFKIGDLDEIVVDIWRYYDKIAIYHRFETDESIFDGQYKNNNTSYVCIDVLPEEYVINRQISDNLIEYISLNIAPELLEDARYKKIYDEYIGKIDLEIEEQKTKAKQNPQETTIIIGYFSLYNSYLDEELSNFLDNYSICEYSQNYGTVKIPTDYYKNEMFEYLYSNGMDLFGITFEENKNFELNSILEENHTLDVNTKRNIRDIFEDKLNETLSKIKGDKEHETLYYVIDEVNNYSYMLSVFQNQYEFYIKEQEKDEFSKLLDKHFDELNKLYEWIWEKQSEEVGVEQ